MNRVFRRFRDCLGTRGLRIRPAIPLLITPGLRIYFDFLRYNLRRPYPLNLAYA